MFGCPYRINVTIICVGITLALRSAHFILVHFTEPRSKVFDQDSFWSFISCPPCRDVRIMECLSNRDSTANLQILSTLTLTVMTGL